MVSLKYKNLYLESLTKEIHQRRDYFKDFPHITHEKSLVSTVYFGGGTPSRLNNEELDRILECIRSNFSVSNDAEISLEANPDDLNPTLVEKYRKSGINRISIGIQSFHEEDLKYLNRSHSREKATEAIRISREAGFSNISADLIFGMPTMKTKELRSNLDILLSEGIEHISIYSLTVEKKTPLYHAIIKGKTNGPDEEESARQYEFIMEYLSDHGYDQYEISNFCKEGYESKHNSSYWKRMKYAGFGPSAHSYDRSSRQWNIGLIGDYCKLLSDNKCHFEKEELTRNDHYNEFVFLTLRMKGGIKISEMSGEFSPEYVEYFKKQISVHIDNKDVDTDNERYWLTKKGKLFADRVSASIFAAREIG